MFGIVVPGRNVDTNFQQVEPNKFIITIPNADSLNHIVVFLTGVTPTPPGIACCLFFSLPNPQAPPSWHYLGYLSAEKPSAIFKLNNLTKPGLSGGSGLGSMQPIFNFAQAPVSLAQIGVSIEPIESVIHMVPALDTAASNVASFKSFIDKTVNNLYNYCASFGRTKSDLMNDFSINANTQFVPLSVIQSWYENYSRRLSGDENFWRNLN